jgi:hypothetical protein
MTDMTDMMDVTSMRNVASEMSAAFSGDETVKPFGRVQISRFARCRPGCGWNLVAGSPVT